MTKKMEIKLKHAYAVLSRLGVGSYEEQGNEYITDCIFCDDVKKNLQINFVKMVYHCWKCSEGGSLFQLINKVTGLEKWDAVRLFRLDEVDVDSNLDAVIDILSLQTNNYKKYKFTKFFTSDRFWRWEDIRGVKRKSVIKFDLGFDKMTNRLVIPLMDEHKCLGLSRRAIYDDQAPKYLNTTGFNKSKFIYGYNTLDMEKDYVVITEGCLDAINTRQLGFNSVALMGTEISSYNLQRISNDFDKIMLMMDNDGAGKYAQENIIKKFIEIGVDVYTIDYETDDPGSIENIVQCTAYSKVGIV